MTPHPRLHAFIAAFAVCAFLGAGVAVAEAEPESVEALTHRVLAALPVMAPPSSEGHLRPSGPITGRQDIVAIIERTAKQAGIPAEIAEAVAHTESRFDPNAVGADGEIGVMQVLPATARMMGFSGSVRDLADPAINIHYGVTYLADAWRLSNRDLCTTVMKYRAGHGETRFSHLSVDYCLKVRARLNARGFAVIGSVPIPTFGRPVGPCAGSCLASTRGRANLAALNNKINQIVFRVTVLRAPAP